MSEVTLVTAVTGTSSTATVNVAGTVAFHGPFVQAGDVAKFVHGSATHCHPVPARPWEVNVPIAEEGHATFTFTRPSMLPDASMTCKATDGVFRVYYADRLATFTAQDSAACATQRMRALTGDTLAEVHFLPPAGGDESHIPATLCTYNGTSAYVTLDGMTGRLGDFEVDMEPLVEWSATTGCTCTCGYTGPLCATTYDVVRVPCTESPSTITGSTLGEPNIVGNEASDVVYSLNVTGPATITVSTCYASTNFDT